MRQRLTERCSTCSSWFWCERQCKNAPRPAQPESVTNKSEPVISRVISRDEGRSGYDRVRDWRARHPETHKARHAAYMRQWRAQKKSPGL